MPIVDGSLIFLRTDPSALAYSLPSLIGTLCANPVKSSIWANLIGTLRMTSLADLLDPDQWIVSGKSLLDFPWPDGNDEQEAMKLILSTRPLLKGHVERWSNRAMEALGRRR